MRDVDTIMIHCSATRPDWMDGHTAHEKRDEIERWHLANGWIGLGYAELYDRDGTAVIGRDLDGDGDPWEHITAGARGHNKRTIHLCLLGGHGSSENDQFEDNFTPEQDTILRKRIAFLKRKFPTIKYVKGHNEVAAKACPGFKVGPWLEQMPARGLGGSTTLRGVGAAVAAGGAGVVNSVGKLDPVSQYILVGCAAVAVLALLWIARERIKKWGRGVR